MPGARCGCAAGAVRWAQSSARMSVMSERLLVSLSLALIGLLLLSGLVAKETKEYLRFDPKLTADADAVRRHLEATGSDWR